MKTLKYVILVVISFVAFSVHAQEKKMTAEQYQKLIQLIPSDMTYEQAQYWIEHSDELSHILQKTVAEFGGQISDAYPARSAAEACSMSNVGQGWGY